MSTAISELHELDDLEELEGVFTAVWGRTEVPAINSDILKALAHSGNYVVGAREGKRLVGGLVGWLGGMPPDQLHLHSHILGVVAGNQVRGLGFSLKQHQREWCLARGVKVVEWTTDPLVRRNAYFNLTKLGAEADAYLVNFYGEMADGLNAGGESDRLVIRWHLDSPRSVAAASGHAGETTVDNLVRDGAVAVLTEGAQREPVSHPGSARVLLCRVPEDIVAVRRSDPVLARAWRMALRRTLMDALGAGFRVSGATRSGWYVLER